MDIKYLFKILKINMHWFLILPLIVAVAVFFTLKKQKQQFKSESLVYTGVATGYNINVESTDQVRTDYLTIKVTFDNIINIINSREAKTEVGIRLLLNDMLTNSVDISNVEEYRTSDVDALIENLSYSTEQYDVELAVKSLIRSDYQDFDNENVGKIYKMLNDGDPLLVDLLLNSPSSPYSIKNLSGNLIVNRKGDSDMIELSFLSNDSKRAQETLVTILDVFTRKQTQLKENEALSVVKYFETELQEVDIKLNSSEEELKNFNEENSVINFQSQTDLIANQKELIQGEYDRELMSYRGAQKARQRLEIELKKKNNLPKLNSDLIERQNKLSDLNDKKVRAELQHKTGDVNRLQTQIDNLEIEIETAMTKQFKNNNNTNNVSTDNLLTEWLQKTIEEAESGARLKVYQQRLAKVNREYDTYAPLGAKLSQLQRKVDIHEEEYLQTMNNLNQAKVRQNNIVMSSTVDIIDYPSKATQPEASKKLVMVVLASIATFIAIFFILFLKVYFDNTIRTPQRAEKLLKMSVIGALPILSKRVFFKKKLVNAKYTEQLINQIISKIKLISQGHETVEIMVFSVYQKEGKTTFIDEISSRLDTDDLSKLKFFEHPALIEGNIHHNAIANKSDVQILIVDSNNELEDADFYHINRLSEVATNQFVVVNKVKKYVLDSILGRVMN